jgi:hypothetical protein
MITCSWCDREFFDGELVMFRMCRGTEMPYHEECWNEWVAEKQKEAETFGHDFSLAVNDGVPHFRRRYFDSQVAG